MKRLLKYLKGYVKETILAPALKLLEASFELIVPLIVASIIDVGIAEENRSYIVKMVLLMVFFSLVGFAVSVTAQYFSAKASVGFASKIRSALFNKIQGMSYSDLDKIGTSTLLTRMTSDINQVQSGLNLTLRLLLRSPFIVFGAMIMAATIDLKSAGIFALMIAVLSIIVFGIMLITIPLHKKVQSNLDRITSITRENLTGVRILRGFCREDSERESFNASNTALEKSQRFAGKISALTNPLTFAVVNLSIILLLNTGAIRVDSDELTSGQVVALYNYMTQILVELIKLANLIVSVTKAVACAQRVSQVLECESGEATVERVSVDKNTSAKIEFKNVSFRYAGAGADSLTNISFSVNEGETVGIIGATGSGKTTLVNLIPAFYLPTEGEILLDGVNVNFYDKEELREKFGIVPQKAVLFSGSIRDNLLWRKADADEAELKGAIKAAQAENIIDEKAEGIDSSVERMGKNFSGGQRQRLTIARALVGEPEILILDDSSSALDYATDAALRESIKSLPYTHTTFIVSQRTSSIMHADKIIVLEDGVAVGIGSHDELYENCSVYREIHDLQFGKEENNG